MDTRQRTRTALRDPDAETVAATETEERREGRGCGCWILLLLVLLGGAAATGGLLGMIVLRTEQPLPGEQQIAEITIRTLMVPPEYADMRLPRPKQGDSNEQRIARGRDLFQAQCAICHGQNADGNGPYGKTMYPKANDLHEPDTQSKSDGQLFWIISHGMNFTGMPAWGEEYGGSLTQDELWDLVAYVRSLGSRQQ